MTPSGMANEMVFHIFSITPWGIEHEKHDRPQDHKN